MKTHRDVSWTDNDYQLATHLQRQVVVREVTDYAARRFAERKGGWGSGSGKTVKRWRGTLLKLASQVVQEGTVIEAHDEKCGRIRLVIRWDSRPGWASVVVVSVDGQVITYYENRTSDNHYTLKHWKYCGSLRRLLNFHRTGLEWLGYDMSFLRKGVKAE